MNMTDFSDVGVKRQTSSAKDPSKCTKCRYYLKFICAHLFSQIGLCALVVGYTIMGAFAFEAIENSSWSKSYSSLDNVKVPLLKGKLDGKIDDVMFQNIVDQSSANVLKMRTMCAKDLWNMTIKLNVFHEDKWISMAEELLKKYTEESLSSFKDQLQEIPKNQDKEIHWTFPAALLYSVTVITTIGYGNIAPKTDIGKIVTIFYALIGIPLMLLCLTTIGDLFAHAFKFTYNKICCALCRKPPPIHCEEMLLSNNQPITNQLMSPVLNSPSTDGKGSPVPDIQRQLSANIETNSDIENEDSASTNMATPSQKSESEDIPKDKGNVGIDPDNNKYPEVIIMPEILPSRDINQYNSINEKVMSINGKRHDSNEENNRVPVFIVLMFVAFYVCLGAAIFSIWEKWSFLDGAYFCFITLSTIGFGDLVPGMSMFNVELEQGQAKLIICCFYLVIGLAIIAMSFNLVQEEVLVKCRRVGRNLGIYNDR